MGTTLAVDIVASGNQAAISDRIVNHLDPARIAAARIVTLVRAIDDDGAWAVNSLSGDKPHSDQLQATYYSEVDQLQATVAAALELADTDAQRAALRDFQAFYWGSKPLTDAERTTLDSQSKYVFTGSDSYLFGNEQIFAEARSGQYLKAAFDYTTIPFVPALDSAQIYIDAVQSQIDKATADVGAAASLTQMLSIGLGLLAMLLGLAVRPDSPPSRATTSRSRSTRSLPESSATAATKLARQLPWPTRCSSASILLLEATKPLGPVSPAP
jgi:hypothetical protein